MTSCHISLVKLKQYLSPFLCLISPCVPQKHATTFNRISFIHFLPPPLFIFYNSIFSNTGILEFDFLRCTAKPGMHGFYPLKTLFESEKCNLTILYPLPQMNYFGLLEISITWRVGEGVLMVKGSRENLGYEEADKAPSLQRPCALGGIVLALKAGKPVFRFWRLLTGFVALSRWWKLPCLRLLIHTIQQG